MRPSTYTPELAAKLCARIMDGETTSGVCRRRGMPSRVTVWRWLADRPEFQQMYETAKQHRNEAVAAEGRRDPSLGGWAVQYSPAIAEEVCARVAAGATMRQAAAGPDMPADRTIYSWLREREDFARMFATACEQRADALAEEMLEIVDSALGDGWPGRDDRPPVQARDALALAKARIDTRKWLLSVQARKKYGRLAAAPEPEPEERRSHEDWLEILEAEDQGTGDLDQQL